MLDRLRTIQHDRAEGSEGGFTLIELLIVIVVLGILAAVTVFALGGVTAQSVASACKADAKSVEVGTEAYKAQNGVYPPNGIADMTATTNGGPYIRTLPTSTVYAVTIVPNTGEVDVAISATPGPAVAATNFDTGNGAICTLAK